MLLATEIPTNEPTYIPTNQPTEEDVDLDAIVTQKTKRWTEIGYYLIYACVGAALFGMFIAFMHGKVIRPGGMSKCNFYDYRQMDGI